MRPLCLDHLSLSDLDALELIDVAAKLDCTAVSLFVTPLPLGPYRDLVNDRGAKADVVGTLQENGLSVGIVEPFMLDNKTDWNLLERTAALAAEIGGTVNALCFDSDQIQREKSVCRLADITRREGVKMAIEAFTLSTARTPADALALAELAGSHVGLTIDTLHLIRTGGSWADFASLPPERIFHVQLVDGPRLPPKDLYLEATLERLPPGRGEFELVSLIPMIPDTACVAVEAPFRAPPGMTPLERGRIIVNATRKLLDQSR